jgi:hypothetical protein
MVIDPTTDIGKLRLKCGDTGDLTLLPDLVYSTTLADSSGNINQAAKTCSMYILAMMSQNPHQKMVQLEIWGSEIFENYRKYLTMLYKDSSFSGICPIPYSGTPVGTKEVSKINTFIANNDKAYVHYTSDETLQFIADANDNSSAASSGWTLVP